MLIKEQITDRPQIFLMGMDDAEQQPHLQALIKNIPHDNIFSGGKRHHEIMQAYLPKDAVWIDIKVPIAEVIKQYQTYLEQQKSIVVFVSGDPFFFGFGGTLKRHLPNVKMDCYPQFNSLQLFAHQEQIPYEQLHAVSVTGRPWHELDRALIERHPMIGVLTDHIHTPDAIARRMREYHLDKNYTMHVAEHLGNDLQQRIYKDHSIEEISQMSFNRPNCVLLFKKDTCHSKRPSLGIPDKDFIPLDGRVKMITKAPIRIIDLSLLRLDQSLRMWDIGACTGSISIEAKRQYPHLHIEAFEIRENCKEIIEENARRHGAPGIEVHIGDFLDYPIEVNTEIDAIFIGGHGGKLKEMVNKVLPYLHPTRGKIVFNAVSADSCQLFKEAVAEAGWVINQEMHIALDNHNPITLYCATSTTYE